jgi:hypothetical protein
VLSAPVGDPGAAKRSTCHIHPPHRSENAGLRRDLRRRGQEAANSTNSTGTISFGSSSQALLTEGTSQTIVQQGHIDGSLGESILLTQFAQPEDGLRWTVQGPIDFSRISQISCICTQLNRASCSATSFTLFLSVFVDGRFNCNSISRRVCQWRFADWITRHCSSKM